MTRNMNRRSALLGSLALASTPALTAQNAAPLPVPGQNPVQRQAQQPPDIITDERVESFPLNGSGHDGEPWRIHFARPSAPASARGYPVLYLIDGNATFPLVWHAAAALRAARPELDPGQVAIVGIGYPAPVRFDTQRRFHDLTPYTAEEYRRARASASITGGQDVFLDFIANELRTAIGNRIPIDEGRQGLFGHSLGGLFTLHTLYTRPHLFQTYIAGDPSIWWNGASVLQEEAGFLAGVAAAGGRLASPIRLLIENSSGQRAAVPANAPRASPAPSTRGNALDSAARLARLPGLEVYHRRFENESHPSMLGPAALDALAFFLGLTPEGGRKI